jgi:hypothetical protein
VFVCISDCADDFLAKASSFCLLMIYFCCFVFKVDALTSSVSMSSEQERMYTTNSAFSYITFISVLGAIIFASLIVVQQIATETKKHANLAWLGLDMVYDRPSQTEMTSPRASKLFNEEIPQTPQEV